MRSIHAVMVLAASGLGGGIASTAVEAADIRATSRIDAVTVYPQSAEITRLAKVAVPQGEHAIVLHLPQATNASSIRVDGKASARLDIGSVDSRVITVPKADPRLAESERRKLEEEIEKLNDEKALLQAAIQAGEAQKKLLLNLAEMPVRSTPGPGTTQPMPDWGALEGLIGTRMSAVQQAILQQQVKVRELDRKIADIHRRMAAIAPASEVVTEVRINVAAASALEADLVVQYQIANAMWAPVYDVRLSTGSKGAPARMQLVRRAQVQQRTGENWDNVTLTLSTTRPMAGTAAPDLTMVAVDFASPPPLPQPRPMAEAADTMARHSLPARAKISASAPPPSAPAEKVAVETTAAQIDNQAFQTAFTVPGRTTVLASGEIKRVLIGQEDLDTQLLVRTVPRLDPTAYLYAKLDLAKTAAPALAGQAVLFRDGVYVGNGRLPQLAPGQTHELGFGADDRVKVKRVVLEDKKGQRGILTSSRTEDRNYQISVKNHRATPIQVHVLDRAPVSMHQDIKVDVKFTGLQPTKRDVNDVRGTMLWELALAADEEKQVAFGYTVTSPADKPIHYREWTAEQIMGAHTLKY